MVFAKYLSMERSCDQKTLRRMGFPGVRGTLIRLLFFHLSVTIFSLHLFAQSGNFLIIENPRELRILNRFEQTVSSESGRFYPFMAFQILNPHLMTGDGFTPAMQVQHGGQIFYFLIDDSGRPINIEHAGRWKNYSATKLLGDTITILSDKVILDEDLSPGSSRTRAIQTGSKYLRLFAWNKWTCVESLAADAGGWAALGTRGTDWEKIEYGNEGRTASVDIESNIQIILMEANTLLDRIFNAINRKEKRNLTTPRWEFRREKDTMVCALNGASSPFEESTMALKREIENLLLGTNLVVTVKENTIEIRTH